jgi:hypothetical protein
MKGGVNPAEWFASPNYFLIAPDFIASGNQSASPPLNQWYLRDWPLAFPTPAQPLASPAGTDGPPTYPSFGYGGYLAEFSGAPSAGYLAYQNGTAAGIDPKGGYGGTVWTITRTKTGQDIWGADKWNNAQLVNGGEPPYNLLTYINLPIKYDADGLPKVPFVASFVPQAGPDTIPTGTPIFPAISYQFNEAIVAAGLAFVVKVSATGATVSGTVTYNSSTHIATWTPSPSTPLIAGVKYLITVSGATSTDGTPMVPKTFSFTAGRSSQPGYLPGRGRRVARPIA